MRAKPQNLLFLQYSCYQYTPNKGKCHEKSEKIEEKWAKSEEKISNEQLEINRKAEPGTIAPGPASISIPN